MHKLILSIIVIAVVMVSAGAQSATALVINEIMYDLPGSDDHREWIEVFNNQGDAVTVATGTNGWRFYDGANHVISTPIQGSAMIPAGGFAVLADNAAIFLAEHAGFSGTVFDTVMSLANTVDSLRIADENGVTLHTATYQSSFGAAGNGKSLERQVDSLWAESFLDGGTPGVENSIPVTPTPAPSPTPSPETSQSAATPTPPPSPTANPMPTPTPASTPEPTPTPLPPSPLPIMYINEFLSNTKDSDLDGEWIELWNPGPTLADISGWQLDDIEGGSPPYTIPPGTIVASGEYRVFWRTVTGLALNNDVDVVRLLTPGGQIYASISYEKPSQGASSNRTSGGAYVWSWAPTPGSPNRIGAVKNDLQSNAPASSLPQPSTEGSNSSEPYLFPAITKSPEAFVNPRIAKTDYLPASSLKTTKADTREEKATITSFAPLFLTTSAKFSANITDTGPQAYRSFFSRHAFLFILAGAGIGASVLIRWRKQQRRSD